MSNSKLRCPTCAEKATHHQPLYENREQVMAHGRDKHGMEISYCDLCQASFEDIASHRKNIHEGKELKCPFCPFFISFTSDRNLHMKICHSSRIGLHAQKDRCNLNEQTAPPVGEGLIKLMSEELCSTEGLKLEKSGEHYIVAVNDAGFPIFSFHVLTPMSMKIKKLMHRSLPRWWAEIKLPDGFQKGHVVPSVEVKLADNPKSATFQRFNWVQMTKAANTSSWNTAEHAIQDLGERWDQVLLCNSFKYKEGETQRNPSLLGKAAVATREGEDPLVICFLIKNETAQVGGTWDNLVSLADFNSAFGKEFFSKYKKCRMLSNVRETDVFQCQLTNCRKEFLDPGLAKEHSTAHVKSSKGSKIRKHISQNSVVCFKCLTTPRDTNLLRKHMNSCHSPKDESSGTADVEFTEETELQNHKAGLTDEIAKLKARIVELEGENAELKSKVDLLVKENRDLYELSGV